MYLIVSNYFITYSLNVLNQSHHEKMCFLHMRKELHGNSTAVQHLYICYIDSTSLLPKLEISNLNLAVFCGYTEPPFMWNLVGNPEEQFSRDMAKIS